MSKLSVDQKNIKDLFQHNKADFLIPDYQRPYAWGDKECQTLWDDLYAFSFPEDNYMKFNEGDEYYLGPIVTFRNDDGKQEVIDGQQRLTTLMLLLRAFFTISSGMKDSNSIEITKELEKCIWKSNIFGGIDKTVLKIDSLVATDMHKEEFLSILRTGKAPKEMKSPYAQNYRFFDNKIREFINTTPSYFAYLPAHILNDCILLPIEADKQETALRIFSTLNDRGLPLSDADIFKAQFYKFFTKQGKKDNFITEWKELEEVAGKIFRPIYGTPMDELFSRYMYYERAKQGIKNTTTEALRKFYEKGSYKLLHSNETFENLKLLADFWKDVENQNSERFSQEILRCLFVLNYAPNSMWTYFTSVYFMVNRDADGMLEETAFCKFLHRTTAFVWAYALTNPGVNALRTPVYAEMLNIINGNEMKFEDFKFEEERFRSVFQNYKFMNGRPLTKSMITWWAFNSTEQPLLSLETTLEIEHIYAKNRYDKDHNLSSKELVESLGNKALLEKRINIRASDYRFEDKKKYYEGFESARGQKEGTKIKELTNLAKTASDFLEADINERYQNILDTFVEYLKTNELLL